jgi:Rieske Fe-S protein
MLQTALGGLRQASAAAPRGGGGNQQAAPEKAGWFGSKLKAADIKDSEFTAVAGHSILISRSGKTITALTNKCTHKGCAITPKAGAKTLTCKCHQAQFNLDGSVAKGPAKDPLVNYAVRLAADGTIEIDPGTKVKKDDNSFSITVE